MDRRAYEQFLTLEQSHWWFRGRRTVYLGLLDHHLDERPRRVLDLGSGVGGFLEGLGRLGGRVDAVDDDTDSLRRCAERGFRSGVLADGYRLPFRDESYDLVCLFDVLEHLDDDAAALREVRRVLRPGGRVFLSVPAYPWLYANNDRVAHHRRRYTRAGLRRLFEQADLALERNTHANVLLLPVIAPIVLALKAVEALFLRGRGSSQHTNLSWPLPSAVHTLLHAVFAAELPFARRMDLPFGHSIAAIARRDRG